jgi:hypothetical protein
VKKTKRKKNRNRFRELATILATVFMRRLFISLLLLASIAGLAVTWQLTRSNESGVSAVPAGDQEFAWIQAATSISAWERFVAGVHRVSRDWTEFTVDDSRAFPEETTATPDLILSLKGIPGRIHIRWYKLSKGASATTWAERLARRSPSPLAVIGGGSSDRALDLARAMAAQKKWVNEAPALIFTTATASAIAVPNEPVPLDLMQVYAGRSFRMCFTNEQIATAVVNFVWSQSDLRPIGNPIPAIPVVGIDSPLEAMTILASYEEVFSPSVYALEWDDDPYSVDLSKQFHRALHESAPGRVLVRETTGIPFSVGGQYAPNHWEAEAAERLLSGLRDAPLERQLLVLPTSAAPARRVLRSVTGALPLVGRNLVAVTGDSINLNNVYRDADIGWNIRALPVPLVFFSHQDPVDWDLPTADEDHAWPPGRPRTPAQATTPPGPLLPDVLAPPTNTDDTLLNRDLIQILCRAAYGANALQATPALIASADELQRRLHSLFPAVFDAAGNRLGGHGEYMLCLRPQIAGPPTLSQVLSTATLEVWTREITESGPVWRPVKRLILDHGRANRPTL